MFGGEEWGVGVGVLVFRREGVGGTSFAGRYSAAHHWRETSPLERVQGNEQARLSTRPLLAQTSFACRTKVGRQSPRPECSDSRSRLLGVRLRRTPV